MTILIIIKGNRTTEVRLRGGSQVLAPNPKSCFPLILAPPSLYATPTTAKLETQHDEAKIRNNINTVITKRSGIIQTLLSRLDSTKEKGSIDILKTLAPTILSKKTAFNILFTRILLTCRKLFITKDNRKTGVESSCQEDFFFRKVAPKRMFGMKQQCPREEEKKAPVFFFSLPHRSLVNFFIWPSTRAVLCSYHSFE